MLRNGNEFPLNRQRKEPLNDDETGVGEVGCFSTESSFGVFVMMRNLTVVLPS